MKYRSFGKLNITASAFGMGCMRPPMMKKDGRDVVDEEEMIRIIRRAADGGVNYFDTAYVYSNGENERLVGRALSGGLRERVYLATKLPTWNCKESEDMERLFCEQTAALQTDYIDFYLIHALDRESWKKMRELGVLDFLTRLKAQGRIKYACFSFHDSFKVFREIIDSYDWDMCQLQYNYLDADTQAGTRGVKYAGERGIPVVVMEGLKGGRLAGAPDTVREIFDSYEIKRSPAQWAFRWLCNMPEIACVLSGVSTMEQCEDNLRIFDQVDIGVMSEEELRIVERVRDEYRRRVKVACTGCRYCMPCPSGVDIPQVFSRWNDVYQIGNTLKDSWQYSDMKKDGSDASLCVGCERCEQLCPQRLKITEYMKEAASEAQ